MPECLYIYINNIYIYIYIYIYPSTSATNIFYALTNIFHTLPFSCIFIFAVDYYFFIYIYIYIYIYSIYTDSSTGKSCNDQGRLGGVCLNEDGPLEEKWGPTSERRRRVPLTGGPNFFHQIIWCGKNRYICICMK